MTKLFYLAAGWSSLLLACLGIVLPILPTTPFLLLSGYCFTKSSQKVEQWLKATRIYRFYVADYAESKSISPRKKKQIIWQIYLLMGISIWLAPILMVKILLACLTLFITYYLFNVIPNKED